MLLFGLITLLEINMQRIIESFYARNTWRVFLSPRRINKARELLDDRQRRNEAIDLLDCLQFCDKTQIIAHSEKIRSKLGIQDEKLLKQQILAMDRLRNRLAHAQDMVTGSSWEEVIDLTEYIGLLIQRCEGIGTSVK